MNDFTWSLNRSFFDMSFHQKRVSDEEISIKVGIIPCPTVFQVGLSDTRCEPVYHQLTPQQRYEATDHKEWPERDVLISREGPG